MPKPIQFPKKIIEKIEKEVEQKFTDWSQDFSLIHAQIIENLALYTGRHYLIWNPNAKRMEVQAKEVDDQVRNSFNIVQSKVRSQLSTYTRNLPTGEVIANSNDDEDVEAARIGTKFLQHDYRSRKKRGLYRSFALSVLVFGYAFLKDVWNAAVGEKKQVYKMVKKQIQQMNAETNEPMFDETSGEEIMQDELDPETGLPLEVPEQDKHGNPVVDDEYYTGNIDTTVVSPLNLLWDIGFDDWAKVPEAIEKRMEPVDYVKKNYPGCEEVEPEGGESNNFSYNNLLDLQAQKMGNTTKNSAIVLEYWRKADEDFPEGAHFVLVNGKIKIAEPMPVLYGKELPYSMARCVEIPSTTIGMGMPETMLDVQLSINKSISQIIENAGDMINIKLLMHETTRIVNVIDDRSGQKVIYGGLKPEYWQPNPLPQTHFQLVELLRGMADQVSGIHKTSEGATDAAFNSAKQVDQIAELDASKHIPNVDEYIEAISNSCHLDLLYASENITEPMLIKIVGQDNKYSVSDFKGSDLRGQTDVAMGQGSMLTQSRSAMREEIEMWLKSNALQMMKPQQRDAFFNVAFERLSYGEAAKFLSELNPDQKAADRENQGFLRGVPAVVKPFEDHPIHIITHTNFAKSAEFEAMADENKMLAMKHLEETQQVLMRVSAPQPQQPALPGMGPEGGGPPTPPEPTPSPAPQPAPAQQGAPQ